MPRQWTEEQKQQRSREVQAYWATHPHPNIGKKRSVETRERMRKPKQRRPQRGNCIICHRPLYSEESVKRGMGSYCAEHGK